jgi:S-formylglutathione hydrolase FrmB
VTLGLASLTASTTWSTAARASATVVASGRAPGSFAAPEGPAIHAGVPATCPSSSDARILDLTLTSTSLSISPTDTVSVRLLLPPGWSPSSMRTWPVLFLLTGHGASYASWTCDTFLEQYVAGAGVIVVMPDGTRAYSASDPADSLSSGVPGFHSDWQHASSDGSPEAWETFHLTELRQILETSYRADTVRAVAGLSMGGLGAMAYAARHPGMFAAAASYSGYLHTTTIAGIAVENGAMVLAGQDTNALWGCAPGTPGAFWFGTQWPQHDPTELAASLLGLPLFVSAGNGVPGSLPGEADNAGSESIEAGALSMGQDFVHALTSANGGVAPSGLVTDFYGNGTHSWAYWDAEICRSMPFLMSKLGVAYTPPSACPVP